jgi:RES domain-containing protein
VAPTIGRDRGAGLSDSELSGPQLAMLLAGREKVEGEFYREVELRWGHPDDVVSGEGTLSSGGRFARRGRRAVYASLSEQTALAEYQAALMRGFEGRTVSSVPHITYPILIRAESAIDLRKFVNDPRFADVFAAALRPGTHAVSQFIGDQMQAEGVQAIIFPSVLPGHVGANVICFLDVEPRPEVEVVGRSEVLAQLRRISGAIRPPK